MALQRLPPTGISALPEILSRHGPLPAAHVKDGEPIQPGRIYVAPPDHHVLLRTATCTFPAVRGRTATGRPSTRCSAAPLASMRPG